MTRHSFSFCIFFLVFFFGNTDWCYSQRLKDNLISVKDFNLSGKLSSTNIRKIIQDPLGFIWIATQDGLNRYDGKDVLQFRNEHTSYGHLNELDTRDLVLDTLNKLIWVLQPTSIAAVNYENCKIANDFSIHSIAADDWNMKILVSKNKLWITSYRGLKVFDILSKKTQVVLDFLSFQNNEDIDRQINKVYHDNSTNIWACFNNKGVYIIDERTLKVSEHIETQFQNKASSKDIFIANDILFSSAGETIIATSTGLYFCKYEAGKKTFFTPSLTSFEQCEKTAPVISLVKLNNEKFIGLSSDKVHVFNYNNGNRDLSYTASSNEAKQWLLTFSSLLNDKENNLWITSSKGIGLLKLEEQLFDSYNEKIKGTVLNHVNCLLPVDDKNILAGLKSGLKLVNKENNMVKVVEPSDYYYHIMSGPGEKIFVSGSKQFSCYSNGKLSKAGLCFPELKPFAKYTFISSVKINDSIWVLATENGMGILVWNFNSRVITNITTSTKPVTLGANLVNHVFFNSKKQLIVLSDNLITVIDNNFKTSENLVVKNAKSGKPYGILFDIVEDENYYWLAVYGHGLLQLNKNFTLVKEYGLQQNLCNSGVYKVYNSGSTLWVTTNNGLSVFNKKTGKFSNYFEQDGLHSNSFEEGSAATIKNYFMAGGENGFTIINPEKYKQQGLKEKLFVDHYKINFSDKNIDSFSLNTHEIYVSENAQQLILHLAIPSYNDQEKIIYYYRIKELQDQWGVNESQNIITLFKLAPGSYTLELKASNNDSEFSPITTLKLYFLPKWYQTWWFKLLVFLTTAGIIYAFYRYRIGQIKKQHEIRKNIATDLHDDLGSTLNSVKVFTNLAISGVKQEESLQQVKDNLTEATMSLRDMIWVLDDSLDTVDELITRLKQFAIPVAAASNIEAIIKADSEVNSRQLTKEEKRNLFLICKEAINNSIKYAGASQIDVTITASGKKIQIVVADNGKGFNVDEVKKGYGLKNMQYRAGQIKFKVLLNSIPGSGTSIIISPV